MSDRKTFLSAVVGVAGVFLAGADRAAAQTATPAPSPSAEASPTPAPGAAALAIAASMRDFDPRLSDDELATIARDIEDKRKRAKRLNPAKNRLRNSDEPVTAFKVEPAQ